MARENLAFTVWLDEYVYVTSHSQKAFKVAYLWQERRLGALHRTNTGALHKLTPGHTYERKKISVDASKTKGKKIGNKVSGVSFKK